MGFMFTYSMQTGSVSADKATCESSGGEWRGPRPSEEGTPGIEKCFCPVGNYLDGNICRAFTGSSTATSNTDQPNYKMGDCQGTSYNNNDSRDDNDCGIVKYIVLFINLLSALVGVVVVGSIIYGGIQYSTAGSDPQKVSAAKSRIRNAIIALTFFLFSYSILNYLVPGGVL